MPRVTASFQGRGSKSHTPIPAAAAIRPVFPENWQGRKLTMKLHECVELISMNMLRVRYEYMGCWMDAMDGGDGIQCTNNNSNPDAQTQLSTHPEQPRVLAASPPLLPCSPRLLVHAGVDLVHVAQSERLDVVKAGRGLQLPTSRLAGAGGRSRL